MRWFVILVLAAVLSGCSVTTPNNLRQEQIDQQKKTNQLLERIVRDLEQK